MKKRLYFWALNMDVNTNKLENINVMEAIDIEKMKKEIKKGKIHDFETLALYLQKEFMYRYWSRTEYEIVVKDLFEKSDEYKIDVWYQIEPNLSVITKYVIEELGLFKKKKTSN